VLTFLIFALIASYPQVSTGYKFSMALKLLSKSAILIAALALFCYMALEISMGTWIRKLMEQLYGGSGNPKAAWAAGLVLTLFGISMMAGRFFTSTIKNVTAIGTKVISVMALVSLGAIVLMIVANSPVLAIIAIVLAGLAFAPIFPTIVGVTFAKFDSSLYGSIFGIIFAVGLLGGTFVPKFIGSLSVGSTVQQSLPLAAAMAALLFIIALILGKTGKERESK
jgi:fucose permease